MHVALMEGARDNQDDVVDHVPIRAVVQELAQRLICLQELRFRVSQALSKGLTTQLCMQQPHAAQLSVRSDKKRPCMVQHCLHDHSSA